MRTVRSIDGNLERPADERISFRHTGCLQGNAYLDLLRADEVRGCRVRRIL